MRTIFFFIFMGVFCVSSAQEQKKFPMLNVAENEMISLLFKSNDTAKKFVNQMNGLMKIRILN